MVILAGNLRPSRIPSDHVAPAHPFFGSSGPSPGGGPNVRVFDRPDFDRPTQLVASFNAGSDGDRRRVVIATDGIGVVATTPNGAGIAAVKTHRVSTTLVTDTTTVEETTAGLGIPGLGKIGALGMAGQTALTANPVAVRVRPVA